ncbi:MAG: hypothetical protein NT154_00225 [Verrucomicrobia bacterium]|nr:hypothetical protein [Verrucomicrobiota bacterium]
MKLGYRFLVLELLALGYFLLFFHQIVSDPFSIHTQLLALFVGGAVMAIFMEGPSFGTIQPVSTRFIWAVLGTVIMGACVVWGFALKGY